MLCCAGLQEGEIGVARGVDVGVLRHVRRLGLVLEGRGGGGSFAIYPPCVDCLVGAVDYWFGR